MKRKYPKMLPCPFCGTKPRGLGACGVVWKGISSSYECFNCGASGPYPSLKKRINYTPGMSDQDAYKRDLIAIESWNRRAEK
jgi:transcription elongation factor Elf1